MSRTRRLLIRPSLAASVALAVASCVVAAAQPAPVAALDNTPWVLPATPPRCTTAQAESGDVAGCLLAFWNSPATTGWGVPPAPGVGEGWVWSGYRYNGSPALAGWESTYIASNPQPVAGLRAGSLETHTAVRALFEGFLTELAANGYRVRDASGYSFRCTSGNGGWSCPSGDPNDLSLHAWGLAIDMNSATNPIRTYTGIDGQTACATPIVTDFPQWAIQLAEKWGLYWGGYGWTSGCASATTQRTSVTRDPPHFEFRGTPSQAAAIAAYNLRNSSSALCRDVVDEAGVITERCTLGTRPEAGWRLPVQLTPPPGATAAVVNLIAVDGASHGYLTLEDCAARPIGERETSAITFAPGQVVATMAIVPLPSSGRFCVYRSTAVHSVVDVTAYLGNSGEPLWFTPTTPTRLIDTRLLGPPVAAATAQSVPTPDATTRLVNLTVTEGQAPGWLNTGHCDSVGPEAGFSNLNHMDGGARANLAVMTSGPGSGGYESCVYSLATAHVIVDELGKLTRDGGYGWQLAPPRRALDSRQCSSTWCGSRPPAGSVIRLDLGTTAPAAAIAVTVTDTQGPGFVTVGRCADLESGAPTTSNVNHARGATSTGLAIVSLDDGEMCVYTLAAAHVVIDVQATLTAERTIGVLPITPIRPHDSRER